MNYGIFKPALVLAFLGLHTTAPSIERAGSGLETWQATVKQDWELAERAALLVERGPVSTKTDAAGGCDGVKDGGYGFHTGHAENPWWQVDLGSVVPIGEVRVWNRGAAAERAWRLQVSLSQDGSSFQRVYQHDGSPFHGHGDKKPLLVPLKDQKARFVRVSLPGAGFLHLDEVEVFGPGAGARNLALNRPADQVSTSEWSVSHSVQKEVDWDAAVARVIQNCEQLRAHAGDADVGDEIRELKRLAKAKTEEKSMSETFVRARRLQRQLTLRNPLLKDFDTILFTKRVPPSFNHMSDQYYGWWSKPGGGIYLLKGFLSDNPSELCLTTSFKEAGSFLRPTLSYDGKKVLFAWCRYYEALAAHPDKLNKANVPEDAFYHLYEMNIDGSGLRQLTRGKYDDFDGRYLPDGRVVFLSTRRGQSLQAGSESAARTVAQPDLPDCYVRCGGGPERPVAVYTLHTMNADGSGLCAISPFEMFEWTPEIARDGSIIYSRWDYIDRDNMPYMGLWAINPDGSNARMIYKNYTHAPHCTFEAKPIPGSHKLVFTASAHHAQTMGSLVLLDPSAALEGASPITRLTPEVPFPEIEGWPLTSYAHPWPLSERFYLTAWGCEGARVPGPEGWGRWHAVQRPNDGMALYVYDALTRSRELLWADSQISCGDPIPVRPRERPPVIASQSASAEHAEGSFLLTDVYQGMTNIQRGEVKALRIVAVPAKTHPTMNFPSLGIMADDPGKCVLGTVPVESDGSAYFRAPAGVIVFFQALDSSGAAVQTMRSVSHVQPGQTLSCIGCHEHRQQAPPGGSLMAATRPPSKIQPGPEGSWPLRFDHLVQPVLTAKCAGCHTPGNAAPKLDLSPERAYASLINYGKPSLQELVRRGYQKGISIPGESLARQSALMNYLKSPSEGCRATLDAENYRRIATWVDTYAQRVGHFSDEQERELLSLKKAWAPLLSETD